MKKITINIEFLKLKNLGKQINLLKEKSFYLEIYFGSSRVISEDFS